VAPSSDISSFGERSARLKVPARVLMIAETISLIGRAVSNRLALISLSTTRIVTQATCTPRVGRWSLSGDEINALYGSSATREETWCIERAIVSQGICTEKKIPLIASMVINFPLAVHDSSLRLWPRVRVHAPRCEEQSFTRDPALLEPYLLLC